MTFELNGRVLKKVDFETEFTLPEQEKAEELMGKAFGMNGKPSIDRLMGFSKQVPFFLIQYREGEEFTEEEWEKNNKEFNKVKLTPELRERIKEEVSDFLGKSMKSLTDVSLISSMGSKEKTSKK